MPFHDIQVPHREPKPCSGKRGWECLWEAHSNPHSTSTFSHRDTRALHRARRAVGRGWRGDQLELPWPWATHVRDSRWETDTARQQNYSHGQPVCSFPGGQCPPEPPFPEAALPSVCRPRRKTTHPTSVPTRALAEPPPTGCHQDSPYPELSLAPPKPSR